MAVKTAEVGRTTNRHPGRLDKRPLQPFVAALEQMTLVNFSTAGMSHPVCGSQSRAPLSFPEHALAGAFIGFLNSWLRNGRPLSAKAVDTLFHRFAWAGITSAGGSKEVHTF